MGRLPALTRVTRPDSSALHSKRTGMAMNHREWVAGLAVLLTLLPGAALAEGGFRVPPYLQHPSETAMTLLWFSEEEVPGRLTFSPSAGSSSLPNFLRRLAALFQPTSSPRTVVSAPRKAPALAYLAWEKEAFFANRAAPSPPYRHRVRLEGLDAATSYSYTVEQGGSRFSSRFTTAPAAEQPIRLIFFADSETEPESTGSHVEWRDPSGRDLERTYLLDQTEGLAANLKVISQRQPDLMIISGDLVESGGEQRDWDQFWLHFNRPDSGIGLASHVPVIAAPGNHEYYNPKSGGYDQPGSERAIARYLTYFEYPSNGSDSGQEGRYYSLDYGPVTIIALDVANDSPNESERDTNFTLLGEGDPNGGRAPAFGPGSRQYEWLRNALERAQSHSEFTFVIFHHVPYSVGPHGWPTGKEASPQVELPPPLTWSVDDSTLPHPAAELDSVVVVDLLVSKGDSLSSGQPVLRVETGSGAALVPSPVRGWIDDIKVSVGDTVAVGQFILSLESGRDSQSGVPVRSLTPLFMRYGVDAIVAGHDEIWQRSEIDGVEVLPGDGGERQHTLHVYDVGIAGDGLRGPEGGLTNPWQKFLVHTDAPEKWRNGVLVEGGKHYGHLEVDVFPLTDGGWRAELKPVHVFPVFESPSRYVKSERRLYDDVQVLTRLR